MTPAKQALERLGIGEYWNHARREADLALVAAELDRAEQLEAALEERNMILDSIGWKRVEAGHWEQQTTGSAQEPVARHGRNCGCTPCRAEDWDAVEAGLTRKPDFTQEPVAAELRTEGRVIVPSTPATPAGLYGKFYGLRRTRDARGVHGPDGKYWLEGGTLVDGWYFVIREGDPAGWAALRAYADACEAEEPELAADLRERVRREEELAGVVPAERETE